MAVANTLHKMFQESMPQIPLELTPNQVLIEVQKMYPDVDSMTFIRVLPAAEKLPSKIKEPSIYYVPIEKSEIKVASSYTFEIPLESCALRVGNIVDGITVYSLKMAYSHQELTLYIRKGTR